MQQRPGAGCEESSRYLAGTGQNGIAVKDMQKRKRRISMDYKAKYEQWCQDPIFDKETKAELSAIAGD